MPLTDTATSSLDVAPRRQRTQLIATIQRVERALAAPAGEPGWRGAVLTRLAALRAAFADHIAITEGHDGLYAELLSSAPHLAHGVDGLVRDHARLRHALEAVWARAPGARPQELRAWAGELLHDLYRHRQRGADLVFEAYQTDIGGET